MKKTILPIIFLLLLINIKVKSQIDTNRVSRNIFYLEAAGIGGYGSLNYERIIARKNDFLICARIGISTYNLTDYTTNFNPDFIIPIAINGLYGKNHKFEFGIGQSISNIVYNNTSNFRPERETNIHANFTIGYRYQKEEGGLIFRCNYSPIIEFYKYYRHWGGISIGYAF
jgi:hypothetical protein